MQDLQKDLGRQQALIDEDLKHSVERLKANCADDEGNCALTMVTY
jgi:hypothetical protein